MAATVDTSRPAPRSSRTRAATPNGAASSTRSSSTATATTTRARLPRDRAVHRQPVGAEDLRELLAARDPERRSCRATSATATSPGASAASRIDPTAGARRPGRPAIRSRAAAALDARRWRSTTRSSSPRRCSCSARRPQLEVEVELACGLQPLARRATCCRRARRSRRCSTCRSSDPEASASFIEEFADEPGVVGFLVTCRPLPADPREPLHAGVRGARRAEVCRSRSTRRPTGASAPSSS